jgi:DNA polymerase-3 subunit epsilon
MAAFLNKIFAKETAKLPAPLQQQIGLKKRIDLRKPLTETAFVAFDTELTGLDFKNDSIISLGAVKLQGGRVLPAKTYYSLIKPDCELKYQSVIVHEITNSDLQDARDIQVVMEEFIDFIGDAVLLGHFVHIDLNFVNRALKKNFGCTLQNPAADTSTLHDWLADNAPRMAKHFHGHTTKTDLFSLAKKYGIPITKSHNAFEDAYITAQLFQRFLCFLPERGVKTLKELLAVARP